MVTSALVWSACGVGNDTMDCDINSLFRKWDSSDFFTTYTTVKSLNRSLCGHFIDLAMEVA